MFKVIVNGIRCYNSSQFIFKEDKVTLIKGKSGIGKSTIFEAITWCLYGKIKGIKNKNIEGAGTYSVEIIFKDFSVIRQVNPKIFKYKDSLGCVYELEAAQGIVIQKFGSEELWYSCSYIEQKKLCPLLYGNNAERMSLLNNLSFWLDNPEKVLDSIDEKIRSCQQEYDVLSKIYTSLNDSFNLDIIKKPIQHERIIHFASKWQLVKGVSIITLLTECETKMKDLRKKIEEFAVKKGNLEILKKEVLRYELEIKVLCKDAESSGAIGSDEVEGIILYYKSKCNECNDGVIANEMTLSKIVINMREIEQNLLKFRLVRERLSSLTLDKSMLEENLKTAGVNLNLSLKKREEITKEIVEIKSKIPTNSLDISVGLQDYIKLKELESKTKKSKELATELRISYNFDIVQNKKKEIEEQINVYNNLLSLLHISHSIAIIKSKLESFGEVRNITDEDITHASRKYQECVRRKDVISCPHCKGSLRFISNTLQKDSGEIVKESEITEAYDDIQKLKKEKLKVVEVSELNSQLNMMMGVLVSAGIDYSTLSLQSESEIRTRLSQYKMELEKLSGILFVELPIGITSDDYLNIIKYQELMIKLGSIPSIDSFSDIISGYNLRISQVSTEILAIEKELRTYESTVDSLTELRSRKDITEKEVNRLKSLALEFLRKSDMLKNSIQRKKELDINITELERSFGSVSLESEYQKLQEMREDLQILKSDVEYRNIMSEKHTDILKKYEEVTKRSSYIISLSNLRKKAYDLQCVQLQSTVDNINNTLNARKSVV